MKNAWLAMGIAAWAAVAGGAALAATDKPVIAVIDFTNDTASAAWWNGDVGRQLGSVLSNELSSSGDFTVVERQQVNAALTEQDFARSGRVRAGSGPATGNVTGARYLVTGVVSAYSESGSSNGGLSFHGIHVGGGSSEAYVAIDLRVLDAETSEIVYSRTVEGHTSDHNVDIGGYLRNGLGGDFAHSKNVPASKAVRAALVEASDYLDCVMVRRDGCEDRYQQKERRRKQSDRDVLDLD